MLSADVRVSVGRLLSGMGPSQARDGRFRLCSRAIREAGQYIRKIHALGGNVQRARQYLDAAHHLMDQGQDIPALAKARAAILLAKDALPKRRGLHAEADALVMTVDLTMDAYRKSEELHETGR